MHKCSNDQRGFLSQISVALREWCPMSSQVFGLSLDLITIFQSMHVDNYFYWKYFSKWNWKEETTADVKLYFGQFVIKHPS